MNLCGLPLLQQVAQSETQTAARLAAEGYSVIRVIGQDAPWELIRALGLVPVRMTPKTQYPTPLADELVGTANLSRNSRSLLQQILQDQQPLPILICHSNSELPQLFATLRELLRHQDMAERPMHFHDGLHQPRPSSARYNEHRLQQLNTWLESLSHSALIDAQWQAHQHQEQHADALLHLCQQHRSGDLKRLHGHEYLNLIASRHMLPVDTWSTHAELALQEIQQRECFSQQPLIVIGSPQTNAQAYQQLCEAGWQVIADHQDWGDALLINSSQGNSWQSHFSDPALRRPLALQPFADRLVHIQELIQQHSVSHVVLLYTDDDEATRWDLGQWQTALGSLQLKVDQWNTDQPLHPLFQSRLDDQPTATPQSQPQTAQKKPKPKAPAQRSRKALQSISQFGAYQREWFQRIRQTVADGTPLTVVNANSPQEILRALDLPFVVNQWWASIAAAKQQSKRYFQLLQQHHYPADVESYSAQGLAALFDLDESQAPWGGLPAPQFLQAVTSTNPTPRIFDHWSREAQADLFLFERTSDSRLDLQDNWWDYLPSDWDNHLEEERLDLLTEELHTLIAELESATGHHFDAEKFRTIMELVNEQEEYYRKTRDLIAGTYPAPVCVADTMPATMVPQWHRGTEWARDAARDFYLEVKNRVEEGQSVCAHEQLRLMWVGRGMWSDMSFYQRWQESHGAVFVWSMYLSLAADGYIRHCRDDQDPMRALAARFVTMGDELRMPTWAGAWHVREAKTHGVHGAIALSDADPFVLRALRRANIPVLALDLDNYHQNPEDNQNSDRAIAEFLDKLGSDETLGA